MEYQDITCKEIKSCTEFLPGDGNRILICLGFKLDSEGLNNSTGPVIISIAEDADALFKSLEEEGLMFKTFGFNDHMYTRKDDLDSYTFLVVVDTPVSYTRSLSLESLEDMRCSILEIKEKYENGTKSSFK